MDPEVHQVLKQRGESIILAGGHMVLIAGEPPIAKVLRDELLRIAFQLVQTLDAPANPDALLAKRAFKDRMLAMLLASAIGFGDIDLEYAQAEGKRLMAQGKVVQGAAKAKEKTARAKAKEPTCSTTQQETDGHGSLQSYLQQMVLSAFKPSADVPLTLLQLHDSERMAPPPPQLTRPPPSASTSTAPPLSICLPEESVEEDQHKWLHFSAVQLQEKEEQL